MAKKLSDELWKQIRAEWEHGATKKSLSEKYDCSVQAIAYHQKKEGWHISTDVIEEVADLIKPAEQFIDDTPVIAEADPTPAATQARIAELEAELAKAQEKIKEYRPTVPVKIPDTPEGWVEYLGEQKIADLAEDALAAENRKRFQKGWSQLDINANPDLKNQEIKNILDKREAAKTKHVDDTHIARCVKVVKPNGTIIQVIVESQVSNEAGQPGAAIWKVKDKGYKLAEPYLCQRLNCWLEAAVDETGKLAYQGYCSPEHMAADPYIGKKPIAGVTTSDMGIGR